MKHLFQVNIGPVQGFIAASRKTRDLTAGSDLLVEITKGVARLIEQDYQGELIFPAEPDLPAANIVLAEVDCDPSQLAHACRNAVVAHLMDSWKEVARGFNFLDADLAEAQINAFPEVSCAWVPTSGNDYQPAKERLDRLASSRKTLREFMAAPTGRNRHMGSLDPGYEQVYDDKARKPFGTRVKPNERLDALGVLKRFGAFSKDKNRYRMQSTRDVAISHLLSKLDNKNCQRAIEDGISVADVLLGELDDYGFDEDRMKTYLLIQQELRKDLGWGQAIPETPSYYAVILADGDDMGKALRNLTNKDEHRNFSKKLAEEFALKVQKLFESGGKAGQLVYAGGDDVLALVPLEGSVQLAQKLHDMFGDAMQAAKATATLSVGLAVVHVQENLRSALEFARHLERTAKHVKGKNAIAIGVRPRSGGDVVVALPWNKEPDKLLSEAIEAFESRFAPHGFPYEVRSLADELIRLEHLDNRLVNHELIKAEYARICGKKDSADEAKLVNLLPDGEHTPRTLRVFADLLVIARSMKSKIEPNAHKAENNVGVTS